MNSTKRLFCVFFPALLISTLGLAQSTERETIAGSKPFQSGPAPDVAPDPAWGTSVESALVIGAYEFQPYLSGTTMDSDGSHTDRWVSAAPIDNFVIANFHLPKGALITGYEIQGCNTDATNTMIFQLHQMPTGGNVIIGTFAIAANAGCSVFRQNVSHQVDAGTGPYMLLWGPNVIGAAQKITAARVYYKLQVSPSPSVATFNDVPLTHPFNKFVEALYASGITAGCGNNNFCPDAPVTRGQMAVFLAAALGLHWAP